MRKYVFALSAYLLVLVGLVLFSMYGCSIISSSGQLQLPTAQQLLATCQAEVKAGTQSSKAPDCIALYAIQQTCNVVSLGAAINPLVATVNPVAGSILTTAATITLATCTAQGFISTPQG